MPECTCEICTRHHDAERILAKMDPTEVKEFVDRILIELLNSETDAAHYKSILDGTWPGSKEILQSALEKFSI